MTYMPENVSRKLSEYIQENTIQGEELTPSAIRQQDPLSKDWEPNLMSMYHPMTSGDIQPLMPAEMVFPWKLYRK
jgi:hypothetical protein